MLQQLITSLSWSLRPRSVSCSAGNVDTRQAVLSTEPSEVLEAVSRALSTSASVVSAHLWVADSGADRMRVVSAVGFPSSSHPVCLIDSQMGRAVTGDQPALQLIEAPAQGQRRQRLVVPLVADVVKGALVVEFLDSNLELPDLLGAIQPLKSACVSSLTEFVSLQGSDAARVLLETARDIAQLVDSDAIVSKLLSSAIRLSGAHVGSVMLVGDDGRMSIAASVGLPKMVVKTTSVVLGEGIAGWVWASGQTMVIEDLNDAGARPKRNGVRSAVSVPIKDEMGMVGVLNVGFKSFSPRQSPSVRTALEGVAGVGSVALRNAQALATSQSMYFDTLRALVLALETKDPYATGQTDRILELVTVLATTAGLSGQELDAVRIAALFHDIGMSASGDASLVEARPLTSVERGLVHLHPVIASEVIAQAPALADAVPIIYHHHEHYDGGGYVAGLAGEGIPVGSRILAVADTYVALTTPRPYRGALTPADAMAEIERGSGTQFDPKVVDSLRAVDRASVATSR